MTADQDFSPHLTERDFSGYEDPALMLLRIRREVEGRLRWLEERLAPDHTRKSGNTPGSILVERGLIEDNVFRAIEEFLRAADPSSRSGKVNPTDAAVLVETGLSLAQSLDKLIEATERKVMTLSERPMLVYRFLELPTSRKWAIAKSLGLISESDFSVSRAELPRLVFQRAAEHGQLEELWDSVAQESDELANMENPFRGK